MNSAPLIAFIVVVLASLLLWRISQFRKTQSSKHWIKTLDEQYKRLENTAVDVAIMIGDVDFEQVVHSSEGDYDIWFKIYIRRTNKTERFPLFINIENLLPLSDEDLDREMTKEVRKKSTELLSRATNAVRSYPNK